MLKLIQDKLENIKTNNKSLSKKKFLLLFSVFQELTIVYQKYTVRILIFVSIQCMSIF